MAKVQISIDDSLLEKIDLLADENFTSRSGFISMGMNEFVKSKEIVSAIKSMSVSMAKIAATGTIDEETQKELEVFQQICGMLTKSN